MTVVMLRFILGLVAAACFGLSAARSAPAYKAWRLSNATASVSLSSCDGKVGPVPGSIPGLVHTDLINAGIIKLDPYFRYEEENLSWITDQCWAYTIDAAVSADEIAANTDLFVRFEGLDTVSTIYFNEQEIGCSANAFRSYSFPIPTHLVNQDARQNVIRIELASARQYAKTQAAAYPYVVPETQNYNVWAEPSSRNFVRKAGSDYGWDWGPAYIPSGVTGQVSFFTQSRQSAGRLAGFAVRQNIAADFASATLGIVVHVSDIPVFAPAPGQTPEKYGSLNPTEVDITVKVNGEVRATQKAWVSHTPNAPKTLQIEIPPMEITNLQLWWPVGVTPDGKPTLYTVEVSYDSVQSVTKKVGFRTVELIQDAVPTGTTTSTTASKSSNAESVVGATGSSVSSTVGELYTVSPTTFYFKINGQAVFMRGANFIPIDSFQSRVTDRDREYVLRTALQANMNMVRVWGGGIYQPDQFYELADSLGVMVWQEIMLACALYPSSTSFLAQIDAEVREQALRLNTHPSIVVWGGNNENEVALGWFDESLTNRDLYVSDYSKLYGATVYPALSSVLGDFASASSGELNFPVVVSVSFLLKC